MHAADARRRRRPRRRRARVFRRSRPAGAGPGGLAARDQPAAAGLVRPGRARRGAAGRRGGEGRSSTRPRRALAPWRSGSPTGSKADEAAPVPVAFVGGRIREHRIPGDRRSAVRRGDPRLAGWSPARHEPAVGAALLASTSPSSRARRRPRPARCDPRAPRGGLIVSIQPEAASVLNVARDRRSARALRGRERRRRRAHRGRRANRRRAARRRRSDRRAGQARAIPASHPTSRRPRAEIAEVAGGRRGDRRLRRDGAPAAERRHVAAAVAATALRASVRDGRLRDRAARCGRAAAAGAAIVATTLCGYTDETRGARASGDRSAVRARPRRAGAFVIAEGGLARPTTCAARSPPVRTRSSSAPRSATSTHSVRAFAQAAAASPRVSRRLVKFFRASRGGGGAARVRTRDPRQLGAHQRRRDDVP